MKANTKKLSDAILCCIHNLGILGYIICFLCILAAESAAFKE